MMISYIDGYYEINPALHQMDYSHVIGLVHPIWLDSVLLMLLHLPLVSLPFLPLFQSAVLSVWCLLVMDYFSSHSSIQSVLPQWWCKI